MVFAQHLELELDQKREATKQFAQFILQSLEWLPLERQPDYKDFLTGLNFNLQFGIVSGK